MNKGVKKECIVIFYVISIPIKKYKKNRDFSQVTSMQYYTTRIKQKYVTAKLSSWIH